MIGTFLLVSAALFVWAFFLEPRSIPINRYHVKVHKLLGRPLRILHLSDIHFARSLPYLNRFFDRLASESFDFVFLTGDIIDCQEGIKICTENLRKLKPFHGMYAVYGNHDYYDYQWADVFIHNLTTQGHPDNKQRNDLLHEALQAIGVRVLRNESEAVEFDRGTVLIHGLDDPTTGRADIGKVMAHHQPEKLNILLTHSVNVFAYIGENKIDLSFSGHSHGGQICLPFFGPVITHTFIGREYVSGVKRLKGATCSISRGVSSSRHFLMRFLCPPEAVVLTVTGHERS